MIVAVCVMGAIVWQAGAAPNDAGQSPKPDPAQCDSMRHEAGACTAKSEDLDRLIREGRRRAKRARYDLKCMRETARIVKESILIKRSILDEFRDPRTTVPRPKTVRRYQHMIRGLTSRCDAASVPVSLRKNAHVDADFWERLAQGSVEPHALQDALDQDTWVLNNIISTTDQCEIVFRGMLADLKRWRDRTKEIEQSRPKPAASHRRRRL